MSTEIENLDKIYSEVFGDRIGTFLEIYIVQFTNYVMFLD